MVRYAVSNIENEKFTEALKAFNTYYTTSSTCSGAGVVVYENHKVTQLIEVFCLCYIGKHQADHHHTTPPLPQTSFVTEARINQRLKSLFILDSTPAIPLSGFRIGFLSLSLYRGNSLTRERIYHKSNEN